MTRFYVKTAAEAALHAALDAQNAADAVIKTYGEDFEKFKKLELEYFVHTVHDSRWKDLYRSIWHGKVNQVANAIRVLKRSHNPFYINKNGEKQYHFDSKNPKKKSKLVYDNERFIDEVVCPSPPDFGLSSFGYQILHRAERRKEWKEAKYVKSKIAKLSIDNMVMDRVTVPGNSCPKIFSIGEKVLVWLDETITYKGESSNTSYYCPATVRDVIRSYSPEDENIRYAISYFPSNLHQENKNAANENEKKELLLANTIEYMPSDGGSTALHLAAKRDKYGHIVRLLLQTYNFPYTCPRFDVSLHHACAIPDFKSYTPLMLACSSGSFDVAQQIFGRFARDLLLCYFSRIESESKGNENKSSSLSKEIQDVTSAEENVKTLERSMWCVFQAFQSVENENEKFLSDSGGMESKGDHRHISSKFPEVEYHGDQIQILCDLDAGATTSNIFSEGDNVYTLKGGLIGRIVAFDDAFPEKMTVEIAIGPTEHQFEHSGGIEAALKVIEENKKERKRLHKKSLEQMHHVEVERQKRLTAATVLQSYARKNPVRRAFLKGKQRQEAAILIQSHARKANAIVRRRNFQDSVPKVQALFRGKKTRNNIADQNNSATKIQKLARKRIVSSSFAAKDSKKEDAAVLIQSKFRDHQARENDKAEEKSAT
eukprot:g1595.t1